MSPLSVRSEALKATLLSDATTTPSQLLASQDDSRADAETDLLRPLPAPHSASATLGPVAGK